MKTYGKLGRSKWTLRNVASDGANFSEEEALSDSFTSEDCGDSITPKTSIELTAETRDSVASKSPIHPKTFKKPLQEELFDFLDQPVLKKRKKTLHAKPDAIYDDDSDNDDGSEPNCNNSQAFFSSQADKSFQSTIDEANTMLSQLAETQNGTSDALAVFDPVDSVDEESRSFNNADTASKKLYGRTRTIVQQADDDDDNDDDGNDDDDVRAGEAIPRSEDAYLDEVDCSQSTQHFNHLRVMGETLKYQDDLEFLMQESPQANPETKTASVLGLALSFLNDSKMLDYAVKQYQLELWEWCTSLCQNANDLTLHVGAFILDALAMKPENHASGKLNFQKTVLPLVTRIKIVPTDLYTKHVELNYGDFLKLTGDKSGLFYGLRLWNLCLDRHESLEDADALEIILQTLENNQSYANDALIIAAKVLTESTVHQKSRSRWFRALRPLCCSQATNQDFVKVLVRLSNDAFEVCDGMEDVLKTSLIFVLDNSVLLLQSGRRDVIEVFVLHLGLCLSLVQIHGLVKLVPDCTVRQTYKVLQQILEGSNQALLCDFNQNMFILICCYFACSKCLTFQPAESDSINLRLKAFAEEIEPFNESIHTNVTQVLDALSV
ncbi:LAFA_0F04610g1_1 [Lachancea sp. 'fantastica']|nr:LAFA_0F04610g1_1 [Lachancea sp. 'fantastica']